jgi:hypothetical protein
LIRLLLLPTAHRHNFSTLTAFGPPGPFTVPSTWPWVDHLVSRLSPYDLFALFRLAFPSAPCAKALTLPQNDNSPVHYAKGTRSPGPEVRIGLPQLVSTWFQVLLTPLKGVLFTVQSPYLFTIGRRVVLSLGGWAPRLHAEFHELYATLGLLSKEGSRRIPGCHLLWSTFPDRSSNDAFVTPRGPATPVRRPVWADPLSLAATYGVSVDFLSSRYLDVSVRWVRSRWTMHSSMMTPSGCPVTPGFPIRTSPDQCAFDHSPGFSQPTTSFIASRRLGIHHAPLIA